ncbi:hypothetical protein AUR64_03065 [Haloprofundus marisrubri]|uniref:Uncharacterized protein n=1 Tax=Haloprofundus marisrubri TaxID=1514971 RepID=A0A0W1RDX8_9EURY|nr:hypothetical protein [Haloprofundus marisrubri]KTG11602.1 hypothetical protein AUR64_03065 [Haloprofundus marisrubri]
MERRTFLATAGIGLATAAAGCTSQAASGGSSPTDTDTSDSLSGETDTETETETERMSDLTRIEANDTVERTVGDESLEERGLRNAHHVAFENPTEETHRGTISVLQSDETVFDESVQLEANASVVVSLTDLGTYTARMTIPALDATEAVTVDPSQFTCNVTRTSVSIQDDGTLDSVSLSTRMACTGVVTETAPAGGIASHTLGDDPVAADTGKGIHTLLLRNPSDETWTTRLLVENDAAVAFDGLYTVEPEGTVLLTLSESGTYSLSASVLETETTVTERITAENFDCNRSSTRAVLSSEGELTANTVSTLMGCDVNTNSTNESS